MKKQLLILAAILMSAATYSQPVDRVGVKGPLVFNKTSFDLAWTDKPRPTYYVQEYLPKEESLEHFNQMLSIHFFELEMTVQEAVTRKVRELEERKKTDSICFYEVTESPDGKEVIVDCMFGDSKGGKMTVAELNIYRFRQVDLAGSKKGILIYAYSRRAYDNAITPFLKNGNKDRTDLLNVMIGAEMPGINPE